MLYQWSILSQLLSTKIEPYNKKLTFKIMQIKNLEIFSKLFTIKYSNNAHVSQYKIDKLLTSKVNKQGKQNDIPDKYHYC